MSETNEENSESSKNSEITQLENQVEELQTMIEGYQTLQNFRETSTAMYHLVQAIQQLTEVQREMMGRMEKAVTSEDVRLISKDMINAVNNLINSRVGK